MPAPKYIECVCDGQKVSATIQFNEALLPGDRVRLDGIDYAVIDDPLNRAPRSENLRTVLVCLASQHRYVKPHARIEWPVDEQRHGALRPFVDEGPGHRHRRAANVVYG